ncbi:PREDICTED: pectinesterase/pectinesterase inhibitor 18-like [Camelina sativa]|uniref:Pectinesterase n=1 Tax=Camelina sativa TaxID=90675 RepID=A0ABM1QXM7_CAMSA|nr:PREDICTED: pectinesterase/pectinesterase inhibitor 18-like [Camelina sativa]
MNADIVVAKDKQISLNEAISVVPENNKRRFIVYVKKGVYKETIKIGKRKTNLMLIGDGRDITILTGNLNAKDGYSIKESATFATSANGFMALDIWFQNTAGPAKEQAVALRVSADVSVIYRCRIDGYQDTLFADMYRQFYRDCYITGTIDFIFGDAAAVFQNCEIVARKPMSGQSNVLTSQGRIDPAKNSGFSFQGCNILASLDLAPIKGTIKSFLGRPWKTFSRVVIMQSFIDDFIDLAGWTPMYNDVGRLSTLFFGEYENKGPGADTRSRVKWHGYKMITDPKEASKFTVANLINGHLWLNSTGVPYKEGL